ncbi:hypothetical protein F8388_011842 [Cannabis sativa]|uniref:CCHC-type domain-containing protein n=2 Tax=Cannabis sativa TaxID=3483 RepID=A0A7J6F307_CANSA|nr:hypothetical protein F8388_011842 [Cannabis sativa]
MVISLNNISKYFDNDCISVNMVNSTEMNALQVQYADKGTVEGFAQDVAGPSVAARHNYETRKKLHFGEQGETEEGETLSSPTDDSDLEWKTGRHYSEEDDDTDEDEGDYVDSDVDLDIGEYYNSDEAGHRNPHTSRRDNFLDPNSNIPNPETDEVYINGKIVLRQFLRFSDHRQFAQVMRDYAVQEGFELQKVKQERIRVTFVCRADACPWRIHASLSPNERLFIIKTFNNTHTCQCVRTNRAANSGWIAKKMVGPISRHPNMSLKGMREELKDTWGIEVNNKRLWRARAIARGEVEGNHVQSYGKLRRYAFMVMQTNPDYFTTESWKKTYYHVIHPIPDETMWPQFQDELLVPPQVKRPPGRPKKHPRRKVTGEERSLKPISSTKKCKNCHQFGHIAKSCKEEPIQKKIKGNH